MSGELQARIAHEDGYNITRFSLGVMVCYNKKYLSTVERGEGLFTGSAVTTSLPVLITILVIANVAYRILFYLTRPLRLPPLVAQILTGIILGPSGFGETKFFQDYVIPHRYAMVLQTFANFGLQFNMFLVGVDMDLSFVLQTGVKALSIALAGIIFPASLGALLYNLPKNPVFEKLPSGHMFWAMTLATTTFPDTVRTLADLKLLRTETGRTAMSVAMVTDLCTWVLLTVAFSAFDKAGRQSSMMAYELLACASFILFAAFVLHPSVSWLIHKTTEREHISENQVWCVMAGVVLAGLITDACGAHSIVGAFLFGLMIPRDHSIRRVLSEQLDHISSGLLMPLFFTSTGLRTNIGFMIGFTNIKTLALIASASFLVKIVTTFLVSIIFGVAPRDALALGMLINAKGVLSLVVLNVGWDRRALDNQTFPIMVTVLLVMSVLGEPLLFLTYKPKKISHYKHRRIPNIREDIEFRMITCVHDVLDTSSIINLLHMSKVTKECPFRVFAVHLVELTGHTAASMLIMNDEHRPKGNFSDLSVVESEHIADTFHSLEVHNEAVKVQSITAVSPYQTMHVDICSLAEDKRASFILLPYHNKMNADGRMAEGKSTHANINWNVLGTAPCSVGVFVARSMHPISSDITDRDTDMKRVVVLFIGGPDGREALAYAWRMVENPAINLTVVRFVAARSPLASDTGRTTWYERESKIDDEFIYKFNFRTSSISRVSCVEKVVSNGQETVAAIRQIEEENTVDLYIVGRGNDVDSPVVEGLLLDWDSSPELGPIGDMLASSNFSMHASALIVQQYSVVNKNLKKSHGSTEALLKKNGVSGLVEEPKAVSIDGSEEDGEENLLNRIYGGEENHERVMR